MAGFIGPGGNNCESDIVMKPVAAREIWLTVFHSRNNKVEWNEERIDGSARSPLPLFFFVLLPRLLFTIRPSFSLLIPP